MSVAESSTRITRSTPEPNMFQAYQHLRFPRSILDVVDKDVLQSLMQGFYYRQKTGLTMLYEDSDTTPDSYGLRYRRLNPFPNDSPRNKEEYNCFCAKFRETPERDLACRKHDEFRAAQCIGHDPAPKVERYHCHMGLVDFRYPVRVAGRVRAVLLVGQRVEAWDEHQVALIQLQVRNKAGDIQSELNELLRPENQGSQDALSELEQEFGTFAETFQKTVNAVYEAKFEKERQGALVQVTDRLHRMVAATGEDWVAPTDDVLDQLEQLYDRPLAFLVRYGSTYVARSVSPRASRGRKATVAAVELIKVEPEKWQPTTDRDLVRSLAPLLPDDLIRSKTALVYRFDGRSQAGAALSTILLVVGPLPDERDRQFLADCCRLLAHPVHMALLIERLIHQRAYHDRQTRFIGHTLKTPITTALFQLRRLQRFAEGKTGVQPGDAAALAGKLRQQLLIAVTDAMMLQDAARQVPEWVDLNRILRDLLPGFAAMGADRKVGVDYRNSTTGTVCVHGNASRLRIALSNLLDNAVKYSFSNKVVEVELAPATRGQVLLTFKNYGLGFKESARDQLFAYGTRAAAFDTRRERHGSGLGLNQAKEFIEECDGTIDIHGHRYEEHGTVEFRQLTIIEVTFPIRQQL